MRFRHKIVLLLICLAIVPIVVLRAFGIHNVRLFAEEIQTQVDNSFRKDAELQIGTIVQNHRQLMAQILQELEMALFFQAFEAHRLLVSEIPCRSADVRTLRRDHDETASASAVSEEDARHHCIMVYPAAEGGPPTDAVQHLRELEPVYRTIGDQLGALVLHHQSVIGAWTSIFPVDTPECTQAWSAAAANDIAAMEDRFSYWSAPYTDPESGRPAVALTLPLMCPDEKVVGWTGIVIDLNGLLEAAVGQNALAEGARAFIGTIAKDARGVGIQTLASLVKDTQELPSAGDMIRADDLNLRRNDGPYRRILNDFLRLKTARYQVVFRDRESHWAFSPIPHQGTGLVLVVPIEQQTDRQAFLETIRLRTRRVELFTAFFLGFLILTVLATAAYFSGVVTRPLEKLTHAARKLAAGDLEARVNVISGDEIGDLSAVFNEIGPQLAGAYAMRRSVELASEIQLHLLPDPPTIDGIDMFGLTVYSDFAGGDYYDFLCNEGNEGRLCAAIGDVSGHGIASALLMASIRSALRMRSLSPGSMGDIATDANAAFTADVEASGNFVTLFLARFDRPNNRVSWIRAGHDPGILYDPASDSVVALKGRGLPFGVDRTEIYKEESHPMASGQLCLLGTDGIWEARNSRGEFFGKARLQAILRENARFDAKMIVTTLLDAVEEFQEGSERGDDMTCVVVKFTDGTPTTGHRSV